MFLFLLFLTKIASMSSSWSSFFSSRRARFSEAFAVFLSVFSLPFPGFFCFFPVMATTLSLRSSSSYSQSKQKQIDRQTYVYMYVCMYEYVHTYSYCIHMVVCLLLSELRIKGIWKLIKLPFSHPIQIHPKKYPSLQTHQIKPKINDFATIQIQCWFT